MTKEETMQKIQLVGMEEEVKALRVAVENGFSSLLIGDTGCGKTYLVRWLAQELGKKLVRVSLNRDITVNEVIGKWLINKAGTFWVDGVLTQAMREGHWIVFDEINAALPEILVCINAVLDDSKAIVLSEKDGEVVTAHEDFRFFATMNPPDLYAGMSELNKALLSRFSITLHVDYPNAAHEVEVAKLNGVDETVGSFMVDTVRIIRKLREQQKTSYICSTRDLVSWARVASANSSTVGETFKWSILNKVDCPKQRELISTSVKNRFVEAGVDYNDYVNKKSADIASLMTVENMKARQQVKKLVLRNRALREKINVLLNEEVD